MRLNHLNPLGVLAGLIVIFLALLVSRAAWRQFGQGHELSGCCLWELSDDLFGCGLRLIGCGSVLAVLALPLLAWFGWRHR